MIKLTEKERIAEDIRARKEIKQKLIDSQNAKADRLSKARQKLASGDRCPRESKESDGVDESGQPDATDGYNARPVSRHTWGFQFDKVMLKRFALEIKEMNYERELSKEIVSWA